MRADDELRRAIELAARLDVEAATRFSVLPAVTLGDSRPNWITGPWPPEHLDALGYQCARASDYWEDIGYLAPERRVDVAIEMHPNMLVYEPHGPVHLLQATGLVGGVLGRDSSAVAA